MHCSQIGLRLNEHRFETSSQTGRTVASHYHFVELRYSLLFEHDSNLALGLLDKAQPGSTLDLDALVKNALTADDLLYKELLLNKSLGFGVTSGT